MEQHIITLILAGILAFGIAMYVLLDGFDLGVGILFPFAGSEENRDLMMSSVTPVWDGNETWLVLGGATLYGAFPVVYSTLLPALYLPLFLMLIALIFRGVSFEFRHMAHTSKWLWNTCFTAGSAIAAFCQGLVLGSFVQGYTESNGNLVANYHALSPFSIMTGFAVVAGYGLIGATWLIRKTEGSLQKRMYAYARLLMVVVSIFMAAVIIWTPEIEPSVMQRWFSWPNMAYLAPLPLIGSLAVILLWVKLKQEKDDAWPFVLSLMLFLWAYVGFIISQWPYVVPRVITIWDAAAPLNIQIFILVGLAIVLPVIVTYTIYSYSVFKGKVTKEEGAHY